MADIRGFGSAKEKDMLGGMVWSAVLMAALSSSNTVVGPTWVEDDSGSDAGSTPATAQSTLTAGPVARISGKLSGLADTLPTFGPPDLEDMYIIQITEPTIFNATTVPELGGDADFNTVLYLFDIVGNPLLGNDDSRFNFETNTIESEQSTLMNMSDDGTNIVVLDPGLYLIVITVFPRVPEDGMGNPLFVFDDPFETSGPDPGAEGPIEEWMPQPIGACCFIDQQQGEPFGSAICFESTVQNCDEAGGEYLGDDTVCVGDCLDPIGACCQVDGVCSLETQIDCEGSLSGVYLGDNVLCDQCEVLFGACCLEPSGLGGLGFECEDLFTELGCTDLGGMFLGLGTNCFEDECPEPTGACCLTQQQIAGLNCIEVTSDDCAAAGGAFVANFTECNDMVCGEAGACCFDIGIPLGSTCSELTTAECFFQGGTFQGMGTECTITICDGDGACCYDDGKLGNLCTNTDEIDCTESFGGYFQGVGTFCGQPDICATGACCVTSSIVGGDFCIADVFAEECDELGGVYQGDDTVCSPDPCNPQGACCFDGSGPDCTVTSAFSCSVDFGGIWQGEGTDCSTSCQTGACCFIGGLTLQGPGCDDFSFTEDSCIDFGGTYAGDNTFCEEGTCPTGLGACCFGGMPCEELSAVQCIIDGGEFQGIGTACIDDPCEEPPPFAGGGGLGDPTPGDYTIFLSGVEGSLGDCDNSGTLDLLETEPEYLPMMAMVADECADAEFIGPGIIYSGNTNTLTPSMVDGVLNCGLFFGVVDGWYKYRPSWAGSAFVNVSGGGATPFLYEVYDGCPADGGVRIGCNDINPGGVTFDVDRGATYYIRFALRGNGTSPFNLTLFGPRELLNPLDFDRNGLPDVCDCPEDANDDGMVDVFDWLYIINNFGPCPAMPDECPADLDGNEVVDVEDVIVLFQAGFFGPCNPGGIQQDAPPTDQFDEADFVAPMYRKPRDSKH
ncbi:MAG: hypothetical protein AAF432_08060 [Planctomycetota bacterium]